MQKLIVVLFLFFVCVDVSARTCDETDENQYIILAQKFEHFLLERCAVEKDIENSTQYTCNDTTNSLPKSFDATVIKNQDYFKVFVVDKGRPSSFLTVLHAPFCLTATTPALFYAPEEEVMGKMREVTALLLDTEAHPVIVYTYDF